ncbi:integrase [Bordetella pertussis]|nr:integrase domain-containing protein [Bordetella pertussis]CFE03140.1 integrase [Bordetella pertussis]CFL91719.1 integrase [Bordetella pertussis]CFM13556.1 integrase [Bordetella pertussis]CFM31492.1 integrase [Bordetella pertussis]CFM43142.1 integrase [Bordetella pertussis]
MQTLLDRWQGAGLSAVWHRSKIGSLTCAGALRRSARPASCRRTTPLPGVAECRYVTNISQACELGTGPEQGTDAYVRMSLQLQAVFGLRREEAIRFQPSNRGNHIALKRSWTKGGREQTVPITTTEQRDALQAAHHLADIGSLIPANKTYIQQRHVYDRQCKAAGLSHMHGLRHQYAQSRYETLTGWKSPAAGGSGTAQLDLSQRLADRHARQQISHELGHERVQVTAVYLGS